MLDNSGSPYPARISGDLTTTSTSAADATGLSFPIGANEVWSFECYMKVGSSSTAGTKYAVNVPSGATLAVQVEGQTTGNGVFAQEQLTAAATLTSTAFNTTGAFTTAAVGAFVAVRGVVANGSTPGTVQVQHAKVTSGTATIYANAYLIARRIA